MAYSRRGVPKTRRLLQVTRGCAQAGSCSEEHWCPPHHHALIPVRTFAPVASSLPPSIPTLAIMRLAAQRQAWMMICPTRRSVTIVPKCEGVSPHPLPPTTNVPPSITTKGQWNAPVLSDRHEVVTPGRVRALGECWWHVM